MSNIAGMQRLSIASSSSFFVAAVLVSAEKNDDGDGDGDSCGGKYIS